MLLLKFCKQKAIQQNGITQLERTISTTIFCNQTLDKKQIKITIAKEVLVFLKDRDINQILRFFNLVCVILCLHYEEYTLEKLYYSIY